MENMLRATLSEYLLIIEPDEQTKAKVFGFKHQFSLMGCKYASNSVPHITISNFLSDPDREEQFLNRLNHFIRGFSSLKIVLNGFQTFTNKTIVINVEDTDYLIHIVSRLKNRFFTYLIADPKLKPYFSLRPHITIARQMTPDQHRLLWSEWKDKQFKHSFKVQKLKLMRREVDPISLKPLQNYQHVQYFTLDGEKQKFFSQGNLFE